MTSKTLLRDLGANVRSPRWAEFVSRYRPMMESFLRALVAALEATPGAKDAPFVAPVSRNIV